jgi:hypothetical protein
VKQGGKGSGKGREVVKVGAKVGRESSKGRKIGKMGREGEGKGGKGERDGKEGREGMERKAARDKGREGRNIRRKDKQEEKA